MELFFKLEAGYLGIAIFILLITIFVTTRKFMPKSALKKGLLFVSTILSIFIGTHYFITTNRINKVETAFNEGKKVICESKALRKVAQSVIIEKSNDWSLNNHLFSSENYKRDFFTARCIEYFPIELKIK